MWLHFDKWRSILHLISNRKSTWSPSSCSNGPSKRLYIAIFPFIVSFTLESSYLYWNRKGFWTTRWLISIDTKHCRMLDKNGMVKRILQTCQATEKSLAILNKNKMASKLDDDNCVENHTAYQLPGINSHNPCHLVMSYAAGSERCTFPSFSDSNPHSWTNWIDSESRLSRFTRAITSFLCSCTYKNRIGHEVMSKWESLIWENWNYVAWRNLPMYLVGFDCQPRRGSSMQFRGREPGAFPTIDTSHSRHNPSMHCSKVMWWSVYYGEKREVVRFFLFKEGEGGWGSWG